MLSVFRREEKKPDRSSLRLQIAAGINTFLSVRGRDSLLDTGTIIVMRKDFEAFVAQNGPAYRKSRTRRGDSPFERYGLL